MALACRVEEPSTASFADMTGDDAESRYGPTADIGSCSAAAYAARLSFVQNVA
jgi:hypothetical protein